MNKIPKFIIQNALNRKLNVGLEKTNEELIKFIVKKVIPYFTFISNLNNLKITEKIYHLLRVINFHSDFQNRLRNTKYEFVSINQNFTVK